MAKPWPKEGIWVTPTDDDKRRIKLSRKDAGVARCVLERYLRSKRAARAVGKNLRGQLSRWQVGGLDADGPRIGSFWVSLGERDTELVLRNTLSVRKSTRHGLLVTLRRTSSGWTVRKLSSWRGHHRRR